MIDLSGTPTGQILDYTTDGVDSAGLEYLRRKVSFLAIVQTWLDQCQEVENALWQLLTERSLATAVGTQLDQLGAVVGAARGELTDEPYRLKIAATRIALDSDGRIGELYSVIRALLGDAWVPGLNEYSGGLTFDLGGIEDTELDAGTIHDLLTLAKAAGVSLTTVVQTKGVDIVTFGNDADAPEVSLTQGLDSATVILDPELTALLAHARRG